MLSLHRISYSKRPSHRWSEGGLLTMAGMERWVSVAVLFRTTTTTLHFAKEELDRETMQRHVPPS
jgi:hypothetical protein